MHHPCDQNICKLELYWGLATCSMTNAAIIASTNVHVYLQFMITISSFGFYRPPTKFWEGNTFSHLYLSVHRRGSM